MSPLLSLPRKSRPSAAKATAEGRRVVHGEVESKAEVVSALASNGDGIAESLRDGARSRRAVELQDAAVKGVRRIARLSLVSSVADVDGSVVGLVERLGPMADR